MKTKLVMTVLFLAFTRIGNGQGLSLNMQQPAPAPLQWNLDPTYWNELLQSQRPPPMQIGRTDFAASGPLIEGLRFNRAPSTATFAQRLRGIPVIRLFVPLPEPTPSRSRGYFAWGERDVPWNAVAAGGRAQHSGTAGIYQEAGPLIQLNR